MSHNHYHFNRRGGGLRTPVIALPRPSGFNFTARTRGIDSGVPSLVSAPATISATTLHKFHRPALTRAPARPVSQLSISFVGLLDVEVRLTVRERLQTLVFASALGLQADRLADFTAEEDEKLRRFQTAYDANRTI